jgi:hypothetical protein
MEHRQTTCRSEEKHMNARTLKALKESIEHWRRIAEGKECEHGRDNDPLCELFWAGECTSCPVAKKGWGGCCGTPYGEWKGHHFESHLPESLGQQGRKARCPKCKEIALKEVAFLESLLPKTKKGRK